MTRGDLSSTNPVNSYRFSGMRLDSGSGTLDMGARRFSPSTARFLQIDGYADALDDLGLTLDPLTGNRYALAGGNPISFMEVDGHWPKWANPVAGAKKVGGAVKSAAGYCLGRGAGNCAMAAAGAGLIATGVGAGAGSAMLVSAGVAMTAGSRALNAYAGSRNAVSAAKQGDVLGFAMAVGTGGRGRVKTSPPASAVRVHGNSKASTKPQHQYVIVEKHADGRKTLEKTGVSGGAILKNGKSARAEQQVRTLNKQPGRNFESHTVSKNNGGDNARGRILAKEQKTVDVHHARHGKPPPGNRRPLPTPKNR